MMGNAHSQWLVVEDQQMDSRGLMLDDGNGGSAESSAVALLPFLMTLRQHAGRILLAAIFVGLAALLVSKRLTPM